MGIVGMLDRNPDKRLGGGANGQQDVQKKAFFQSIDFALLYQKKITPPFKPEVSENPLKYVDKEFLGMATANSEAPGEKEVMKFDGFDYAK